MEAKRSYSLPSGSGCCRRRSHRTSSRCGSDRGHPSDRRPSSSQGFWPKGRHSWGWKEAPPTFRNLFFVPWVTHRAILSPASTLSTLCYPPAAPTVLPLRVPDGNQGRIRAHVPFSMSDLKMEEDELASFSEDPGLFNTGVYPTTEIFWSHLGRLKDLTVPPPQRWSQ